VINSGTGYVTALLASMADEVIAFDSNADFVSATTDNLAALNINNVTVDCGDGIDMGESQAPYNVIVVLGSMQVLAESIKKQLKVGGRMFCIIGKEPTMEALLITRISDNEWLEDGLFETLVPALENTPEAEQFHSLI